jgi:uncharacterized protein YcbK (DUF882 family)
MIRRPVLAGSFLTAFLLAALPAKTSRADVSHVVAKGHTLEAIAHRYHVTVQAIAEANHISAKAPLKVGETLTIPGVAATGKNGKVEKVDPKGKTPAGKAKPPVYAMRARTPGVIHTIRLATTESFTVRTADHRGHVPKDTYKVFEKMLRSAGGLPHPIDARLISLVGTVSNHFGSRPIQIISGFRPYSPTQHTPHSNHNIGRAMDFRVVGVPNEVVRDFCRSLKNVGVGYYPNSTFVHLDVRETPAYWIDYSRPGETPRYNSPNSGADEGTSDVVEDAKFLLLPQQATPAPRLPSELTEPDGTVVPAYPTPGTPLPAESTGGGSAPSRPLEVPPEVPPAGQD